MSSFRHQRGEREPYGNRPSDLFMRFWHSPTAFVGIAPVAVLSLQKHRFLSFLGFTVTTPFETIGACRRLDENRTLACNERHRRQQNMLTRLAADSLYLIRAYFI